MHEVAGQAQTFGQGSVDQCGGRVSENQLMEGLRISVAGQIGESKVVPADDAVAFTPGDGETEEPEGRAANNWRWPFHSIV